MTIQDAYKWLYQATLGGEHAVSDDSGPRTWLDREWAGLGRPFRGEAIVEKLTPDGRLLRVNLRPYKALGGDKEMLLGLFVASAQAFRSEKAVFLDAWRGLGETLRFQPGNGRLSYAAWLRFDRTAKQDGYTAVHHSRKYERGYKPAYRVVLGELWVGEPNFAFTAKAWETIP